MKVLLDACTPVQVGLALPGHDVRTAQKMGWGAVENGELLGIAVGMIPGFGRIFFPTKSSYHYSGRIF